MYVCSWPVQVLLGSITNSIPCVYSNSSMLIHKASMTPYIWPKSLTNSKNGSTRQIDFKASLVGHYVVSALIFDFCCVEST